jgi:hypothetical protein
MSEENVEIVRAAIQGFNHTGHWDLNDVGPDYELDLSRSLAPQRGVFHGRTWSGATGSRFRPGPLGSGRFVTG